MGTGGHAQDCKLETVIMNFGSLAIITSSQPRLPSQNAIRADPTVSVDPFLFLANASAAFGGW